MKYKCKTSLDLLSKAHEEKVFSSIQTVCGGRHLEISSWQDYRTCMEQRASNRNCSTKDKFKPVIQGTWKQGKTTRNLKT